MEIIDADFATITQLEVLEALRSPPLSVYPSHQDWREALRAQKAGKPLPAPFEERTFRSMENICFVTAKTRQYLETQPAASQSYEGNHEFLQALDQALGKKVQRFAMFDLLEAPRLGSAFCLRKAAFLGFEANHRARVLANY